MKKRNFILFLLIFFSFYSFSVNAFEFNGTVLDVDGNPLNNSVINITIRNANFAVNGYNATHTNSSGGFNLTVADVTNAFYEVRISWINTSTSATEWVGQNMPAFPSQILQEVAGTTFYLREAGTLNITAINSTSGTAVFKYQVKDQALGYPIAAEFDSYVSSANIVVPRNRTYSIMIYPNESMPVSFNWNNFSANASYNVGVLSNYNITTKTLNYRFNTTLSIVSVSGYINHSNVSSWNEFKVVPYLLEPGNMLHLGQGAMPFNISSAVGGSDIYNITTGFYNISLPSTPAETTAVLLFATARNGSTYYGGFRNISNVAGYIGFNFTSVSVLLGNSANITMNSLTGGNVNVSTAKQTFNILNSTNNSMNSINAHIEITLDYSSFQAQEFTWMVDIEQGSNSVFYVPLLNLTGIKEMNVFVSGGQGDFAPKRKSYALSEIQSAKNISVSSFSPGDIDGAALSGLKIALIKSNSSCDVPNPAGSCYIGGDASGQAFGETGGFDPMSAVLGGGKLSFRMGLISSGIIIHYVNVDLLASGPPDALFDDSASTAGTTTDSFSSAMRFGSNGPTIYDYVLISLPYTETAGSGLNDANPVNVSIPLIYDENWNVVWNTAGNGTSPANLAANNSHYSAQQSAWGYLLNQSTCGTNQNAINITNPCYIDTSNNRIWIRLPHFSGTGASISGDTTAATSTSSSTSSSSSGGGGGGAAGASGGVSTGVQGQFAKEVWTSINAGETANVDVKNGAIGVTEVSFTVPNIVYGAWVQVAKKDSLPSSVSGFSGKVYRNLEITKSTTLNKEGVFTDAIIKFKVENSWLAEKKLTKEAVALHRYTDGQWIELETVAGEDDGTYVHYTAKTPGFSYFVIGEKSVEKETVAAPVAAEVPAEQPAAEAPAEAPTAEKKGLSVGWLAGLLVALAVVAALVLYLRKRK